MSKTTPVVQATLAEVIASVKRELAIAENTAGPRAGLALATVEISLAVSAEHTADGKLTIGVPLLGAEIGGGGERTSSRLSTVTVVLAPPEPSLLMSNTSLDDLAIAQAIVDIRTQLASGLDDEPRLLPSSVEYALEFGVARSGGPSGKVSFLVFSASAGSEWSDSRTNQITLAFEASSAP